MTVRGSSERGVSLVEALVALAVMAFGMLGVMGMQMTLRANSDVSKQRAEAVRIAQERMEDLRAFEQLAGGGSVSDFDADIADEAPTALTGITNTNTTFVRSTVVTPGALAAGDPRLKTVTVAVTWTDRNDQPSSVTSVSLVSSIAGIAPALAGSLGLPADRAATQNPRGRKGWVPATAKDLPGTGTSVFMPPQPAGGTVAWVFNNASGMLTGVCTVAAGSTTSSLDAADVAGCSNNTVGQVLSGYVRFARTSGPALTADDAENPSGTPLDLDVSLTLTTTHPSPPVCFDDAEAIAQSGVAGAAVTYFCAIFSNEAHKWGGRSRIVPVGAWTIGPSGANVYEICRYTPLTTDTGTRNADHPLDYVAPSDAARSTSLMNQNFLVISSAHECPTDVPSAGDFVNSNTRLHQNGSTPYD